MDRGTHFRMVDPVKAADPGSRSEDRTLGSDDLHLDEQTDARQDRMLDIFKTAFKAKHRWAEGNETIHSILRWHEHALHGDNEVTINKACLDRVEAEANYGTGQLLFLRERFISEVLDSTPTVELVKALAKSFKNIHASTLWRLVETAGKDRPILGVMHYHPSPRFASSKNNLANPCRHFITSDAFAAMFSGIDELSVFQSISEYILPKKGGPVGKDLIVLTDDNGNKHEFSFETFNFGYECLTLAVHLRKLPLVIGVL